MHRVMVCICFIVCDSAGVMYWGDASLDKIEIANLDGTGRRLLGTLANSHFFAFTFHAGNIYFTDWASQCVYLFLPAVTAKPYGV